jgi:hypothetical protein
MLSPCQNLSCLIKAIGVGTDSKVRLVNAIKFKDISNHYPEESRDLQISEKISSTYIIALLYPPTIKPLFSG